eukprot:TRINITY_DN104_c0_g1_i1.p1 TRINITY_DN104_c0_g1~~TRINITY_DN104_c0_g1_i1.p1  ORF type:complete len:433 (+),score=114.40 TRINITY_DN104_c0_g1_i1:61-1359(+)
MLRLVTIATACIFAPNIAQSLATATLQERASEFIASDDQRWEVQEASNEETTYPLVAHECSISASQLPDGQAKVDRLLLCQELGATAITDTVALTNAYHGNGQADKAVTMLEDLVDEAYRSRSFEADVDGFQEALSALIMMLRNAPIKDAEKAARVYYKAKRTIPEYVQWQDTMMVCPGHVLYHHDRELYSWWTPTSELEFLEEIEEDYEAVKDELDRFLEEVDKNPELEQATHREFVLYEDGAFDPEHCMYLLELCYMASQLIEVTGHPLDTSTPPTGTVKLIRVPPNTVLPATVAKGNTLVMHLPMSADLVVRVANETRDYIIGKPEVLDGCFEQQITNQGQTEAYIVSMTVYHPDRNLRVDYPEQYDDELEAIETEAVRRGRVEPDGPCGGGDDEDGFDLDEHLSLYEDEEYDDDEMDDSVGLDSHDEL